MKQQIDQLRSRDDTNVSDLGKSKIPCRKCAVYKINDCSGAFFGNQNLAGMLGIIGVPLTLGWAFNLCRL